MHFGCSTEGFEDQYEPQRGDLILTNLETFNSIVQISYRLISSIININPIGIHQQVIFQKDS